MGTARYCDNLLQFWTIFGAPSSFTGAPTPSSHSPQPFHFLCAPSLFCFTFSSPSLCLLTSFHINLLSLSFSLWINPVKKTRRVELFPGSVSRFFLLNSLHVGLLHFFQPLSLFVLPVRAPGKGWLQLGVCRAYWDWRRSILSSP